MTLVAAGALYLALGFVLWVHAWAEGATTHTLCGCGDPALFLWFFQWPATALAHGQNPFFSTALFHPHGINLLAQTSVTGLSVPLVPVTWIWGPVASLNVASTITPALTAFTAFVVIRRWVSWTPAAFVGGLLYGFSPFVLSSLEFAHLMTAALMLLPLILAVLDEILVRQRHSPLWAGVLLAVLLFAQFFLSSELLAIVVGRHRRLRRGPGGRRPGHRSRHVVRRAVPLCRQGTGRRPRSSRPCSWPGRSGSRSRARPASRAWSGPTSGSSAASSPRASSRPGYPPAPDRLPGARRLRGRPAGLRRLRRVELPRRHGRRRRWPSGGTAACGSSASSSSCASPARWASATGSGSRRGSSPASRCSRTSSSNASWRSATWPPPSILAVILDRVHRASLPDWRGRARIAERWPWPRSPSCRWPSSSASACPSPCRRSRCPAGTARWPRPCPRAGPAVVPGPVLGAAVRHGLAGRQPHALQPGRRRRAPGRGGPGRVGQGRLRGCCSLLDFGVGLPEPAGTPGPVRRRAPRAGGVAGQHRRHRHRPGRAPAEQGHDPAYAAAFMTAALGRPPTSGRRLGLGTRRGGSGAPSGLPSAGRCAGPVRRTGPGPARPPGGHAAGERLCQPRRFRRPG